MTPEIEKDNRPTSDSALASASGSTVPFNDAQLDRIETPTLFDGLICDLPDNRRVEVWRVKEDEGYCIRIFRPTNDGKTSKLVFGLKPPAARALMQLLSKQLSNDALCRPAGDAGGAQKELSK